MPLPPMFGITVSNVSSFWPAGPHPNETLCPPMLPANSKAEDLQCGYPQWHPFQICGKRSTTAYGDDSHSWCPASRRGDEGYLEDGDQYIRFAWDPTASLKKDGFTEYIEITFEQSVYLHSVEVGEPRGMGAIVRIKALHPVNGDYFTIWESSTSEGDPTIQYRHRTLSEYRIFAPFPICQTTFKTNTVRLELDTYTVKDWNELDYIQLVGSSDLPRGVFGSDASGIEFVYVPEANAFGTDSFEFATSDCAFQPSRQSKQAKVAVGIMPVNDAPMALNFTASNLAEHLGKPDEGLDVFSLDLGKLVTDVDGDVLTYTVDQVKGDVVAHLDNSILRVTWKSKTQPPGFEVQYTAMDPSKEHGTAFVSHYPSCGAGI